MNGLRVIGAGLLLGMLMYSCDNSREKQLSKTWQVRDVEFEKTDTSSVGHDALLEGGEVLQRQMMENMLGRPTYVLNRDGSCEVSNKGRTNKGRWKLQAGGKELLIVNEGISAKEKDHIKPAFIEQLDDTSLTLLLNSEQSSYKVRFRLIAKD
jgi:hypothetical protein